VTVLAAEPLLTAAEWEAIQSDPTRDGAYLHASALGSAIGGYLRFKAERASPATLRTYEGFLARVAMWAPGKPIGDWTMIDLYTAISDTAPPKSRNVSRAAVRDMWKWAKFAGLITVNVAADMPDFRTYQPEPPTIFTDAEELRLRDLPELRDRALMSMLLGAGIRNGEARGIQWKHVNLELDTLRVLGKGRRYRFIPIGHLAPILSRLSLEERLEDDDHLWYGRRGNQHDKRVTRDRPISGSAIQDWWHRSLETAEVRYRNMHVTRHTFATKYLSGGGTLHDLADILGHSTAAVTDRYYTHLSIADIAKGMETVMATRGWT
jgi:integrase/recombinase XerC